MKYLAKLLLYVIAIVLGKDFGIKLFYFIYHNNFSSDILSTGGSSLEGTYRGLFSSIFLLLAILLLNKKHLSRDFVIASTIFFILSFILIYGNVFNYEINHLDNAIIYTFDYQVLTYVVSGFLFVSAYIFYNRQKTN